MPNGKYDTKKMEDAGWTMDDTWVAGDNGFNYKNLLTGQQGLSANKQDKHYALCVRYPEVDAPLGNYFDGKLIWSKVMKDKRKNYIDAINYCGGMKNSAEAMNGGFPLKMSWNFF